MLSNGTEAKVGTLGSKYEFFHEWKRLAEEDQGSVALETMLRGICRKENFLDLFENFILYDHSGGHTAKILARNHQYLGVNEAIKAYAARKLNDGKLGVFWHTQGSGKSYSMVFLAQKVRRKFEGSPTFVVLTDRDELNTQISDTFENCGLLGKTKAPQFIASSGDDLVSKLKGNPSFIFTLIQKFNKPDAEPIYPDHDIIIMSDEAHRSQYGIFADNMMKLLPTAARIGFTGTPLLSIHGTEFPHRPQHPHRHRGGLRGGRGLRRAGDRAGHRAADGGAGQAGREGGIHRAGPGATAGAGGDGGGPAQCGDRPRGRPAAGPGGAHRGEVPGAHAHGLRQPALQHHDAGADEACGHPQPHGADGAHPEGGGPALHRPPGKPGDRSLPAAAPVPDGDGAALRRGAGVLPAPAQGDFHGAALRPAAAAGGGGPRRGALSEGAERGLPAAAEDPQQQPGLCPAAVFQGGDPGSHRGVRPARHGAGGGPEPGGVRRADGGASKGVNTHGMVSALRGAPGTPGQSTGRRRGVVTPPYGVQREEYPAARRGRRALRGAAQVVHSSGPMEASAPAGAGTKAGTAGRGHRERGEILQFPWVCLLFFLRQTIIMKEIASVNPFTYQLLLPYYVFFDRRFAKCLRRLTIPAARSAPARWASPRPAPSSRRPSMGTTSSRSTPSGRLMSWPRTLPAPW